MPTHFTIVKYFEKDEKYEEGCGDHLPFSHTFVQCDIRINRFSKHEEAERVLRIVHDFNPTVSYGIATIETDAFGFITADVPTRVGVLKRDQKTNDR